MTNETDISAVDQIVKEHGSDTSVLLPVLHAIQEHYNYLPRFALRRVCEISDITPAAITGVSSFFPRFRRAPAGKHTISVCDGTACHVKGATAIHNALRRELGLSHDDDTDEDGLFTLQKVACLGCCTLAPAVQIDGVTYGHLRTDTVAEMIVDFIENETTRNHHTPAETFSGSVAGEIRIGLGSCCVAGGSAKIRDKLEESLRHLDRTVEIKPVGCVGMCHRTPMVEIVIPGKESALYAKVTPDVIPEIITRHFSSKNPFIKMRAYIETRLERLYSGEEWNAPERYALDVRDKPVNSFLGRQRHLVTESCGVLNPSDIEEYKRLQGFQCLDKIFFELSDAWTIDEIKKSGLRGRGGAGFPTGMKWDLVKNAEGDKKYIICNGDEGDPGAFMDRMILESYPYRVIEGMIVASFATGVHNGIFYIRSEYPLAVRRVREAIEKCEASSLLGNNILGSGHSFQLKIVLGGGAFVCGEESALIATLEGRRGNPALRPPYPSEKGLHGCPTLVNNAETFALVPWIIRNGADAFAALGTEQSKGTKVFSLAGKVRRGGLIEVPMGITIDAIVNEIGGGVEEGQTFKAVQIGGPSGGCIPAALANTTVDYEALITVGAMMGSGGLVVLDDRDCMVEMARYFLSFTQNESCGKCTPCRVGTRRMLEILTRLCNGNGKKGDIERLERLAEIVHNQSLCGLGKSAPNPILTTLKYFRSEYEAHIAGHCPAGTCKKLITYSITAKECIGCTKCVQGCPVDAISGKPYEAHRIDSDVCIRCDNCKQVCPTGAVKAE